MFATWLTLTQPVTAVVKPYQGWYARMVFCAFHNALPVVTVLVITEG